MAVLLALWSLQVVFLRYGPRLQQRRWTSTLMTLVRFRVRPRLPTWLVYLPGLCWAVVVCGRVWAGQFQHEHVPVVLQALLCGWAVALFMAILVRVLAMLLDKRHADH
jgi:hypothetical protein